MSSTDEVELKAGHPPAGKFRDVLCDFYEKI